MPSQLYIYWTKIKYNDSQCNDSPSPFNSFSKLHIKLFFFLNYANSVSSLTLSLFLSIFPFPLSICLCIFSTYVYSFIFYQPWSIFLNIFSSFVYLCLYFIIYLLLHRIYPCKYVSESSLPLSGLLSTVSSPPLNIFLCIFYIFVYICIQSTLPFSIFLII